MPAAKEPSPLGLPLADGAAFYVTCIDGARVGYLAGPYETHAAALADVERVRKVACEADPWADFYAFGTAAVRGTRQPGALNAKLGL